MTKDDDITLQVGFEPDLNSLKKAAEAGAKAYAASFSNAVKNTRILSPDKYVEKGNKPLPLYGISSIQAALSGGNRFNGIDKSGLLQFGGSVTSAIKQYVSISTEVLKTLQETGKIFKGSELLARNQAGLLKTLQETGKIFKGSELFDRRLKASRAGLGKLIEEKGRLPDDEMPPFSNEMPKCVLAHTNEQPILAHYSDDLCTSLHIAHKYPEQSVREQSTREEVPVVQSVRAQSTREGVLVGQSYTGNVNWTRGRYPDDFVYRQGLPAPENMPLLEHPAVFSARRELSDFINALKNTQPARENMDVLRAKDIENLDVVRKHFFKTKSWDSHLWMQAYNNDKEDGFMASPFYQLRAAQFIKDKNYRDKFGQLLQSYGGPEGFFSQPAAVTWKYHPLFAHGYGGLVRHTDAVMQGVFQDAVKAGFSPEDTDKLLFAAGLHDALKYQQGRPNKTHAGDMAFVLEQLGYNDEASWVRTHMGKVSKGYGAGEPEPENKYQKLLADTDFLVSRQYAQFATDLKTLTPDMDKLREMAVEKGEGRWIDPNGPHNAANWERIAKDEDEIEKSSKRWLENVRSIAGVIGAIYTLYKAIKAVKKFDSAAVAGTAEAAEGLPNRRYYAGFDVTEAMRNKSAARAAGIDENAVNTDVATFSEKRGQMTLLGQGFDLLPLSILGQWQNMMQSGNANDAWWNTLESVAKRYEDASPKEREQLQQLLDKTLGKAATELLAFARNNNMSLSDLRALRSNPNWSSYGEVEGLNFELQKLNESIRASYQELYNDWNKLFGIPFREYWDNLLQKTVPLADGVVEYTEKLHTRQDVLNKLNESGGNTILSLLPVEDTMHSKVFSDYGTSARRDTDVSAIEAIAGKYGAHASSAERKATWNDPSLRQPLADRLLASGMLRTLKSKGYSNDKLTAFFEGTLLDENITEDDFYARILAQDIHNLIKKRGKKGTFGAEFNAMLDAFFNQKLPLAKMSLSLPAEKREEVYDRMAKGELAINIYTEMSSNGTLDVKRVTTVGGEDILTKINSIPANK